MYLHQRLECLYTPFIGDTLRLRHKGRDGVSNRQPYDCLLNRLFRHRSKKTSKLRVTGLCVGNSPGTGEFPAQNASKAENVAISWRHHDVNLGVQHSLLRKVKTRIYNHKSVLRHWEFFESSMQIHKQAHKIKLRVQWISKNPLASSSQHVKCLYIHVSMNDVQRLT